MYYDSHCHLDVTAFDHDRHAVFERSRALNIRQWMLAGVEAKRWSAQRRVCAQEEGCVWAAGVHPQFVSQYAPDAWTDVVDGFANAFSGQCAATALGEIGLHTDKSGSLPLQIDRLYAQLDLARSYDKPVILHVVKAHNEMLSCLSRFGGLPRGGVIHGFTGGPELAACYLKHDLHLGINGRWLHGGGRRVIETITVASLNRLLIESDAPDQSVTRGHRNEPTSIIDAARVIGRQKQLTTDSVLVQCSNNARGLFERP